MAGPSAKEILSLPRVVIVPGEWMPERVKILFSTIFLASFAIVECMFSFILVGELPKEEMIKVEAPSKHGSSHRC